MSILNRLKNAQQRIKEAVKKPSSSPQQKESYFTEAENWAYERYQIQEVMANRWQLAFWFAIAFSILLLILFIMLFPLKSWEPIVVQRNTQTGEIWVDAAKNHYLPETSAEVQSDLVRYVVSRETYTFMDDNVRSRYVHYTSSPAVFKGFEESRDTNNPHSLINMVGTKGFRTVKVEDVVFLDNSSNALEKKKKQQEKLPTLAKVDFITTETQGQLTVQKYWVATISFSYLGLPDDKDAAWSNWNGFTVTDYRVDQRNV